MKAKPVRERVQSSADAELDSAAKRVFEIYGSNLSNFFRAVHSHIDSEQIKKKHDEEPVVPARA